MVTILQIEQQQQKNHDSPVGFCVHDTVAIKGFTQCFSLFRDI